MIDISDISSSAAHTYKLIFDNNPQGILISDLDGVVVHCNPAAMHQLCLSKEVLNGQNIADLFSNVGWLNKVVSMEVPHSTFKTSNDDIIYLDLKIEALQDESIALIFLNKSPELIIKQELSESINHFETMAQLAPIGIFVVDVHANNIFVNIKWQEFSGMTPVDAAGQGWQKAIYNEDINLVQDGWKDFLENGTPFDYEYRYIHQHTKKITDVHSITVPYYDEQKRIIGYVGVVQDISEAKRLRSQLQKTNDSLELEVANRTDELVTNRNMLRKACRLAKLGHWEVRLTDNFSITWSEEYINIFEPHIDVDTENSRFFLQYTHLDDREKVISASADSIRKGVDTLIEYRIVTGSGVEKFLQEEIQCYKDNQGRVKRIFGVTQDITEVKKSQQGLMKALEQERNLSVLKSRFVSMASHEFRTPLTAILSSAELITLYGEKQDYAKIDKHAHKITASVGHLTYILEDFLSLEKVESGTVQTKKEPIQLSLFITDILEEMSLMIKEHNMRYDHSGQDNHMVDTNILRNILHNLISNAVKYSPKEKPISITSSSDGTSIKISVSDQGIGIPLEEQQNMFRRFFRASNTSTIQGTGLGLTIVSRYLDIIGGSIDFTSTPGQRTTFNIYIPTAHEG